MSVLFRDFLRESSGSVQAGGAITYVIILGLFMAVVSAMGSEDGARRLAGHSGPTLELDIRGWIEGLTGASLPQVGPINGR